MSEQDEIKKSVEQKATIIKLLERNEGLRDKIKEMLSNQKEDCLMKNPEDLNLQGLDIILCAGNSGMSRKIQTFQRLTGAPKEAARISHVAGIYKHVDMKTLHVQESTTLNKFNGVEGVQMSLLPQWLKAYDGEVWIRQLCFYRSKEFYDIDGQFWLDHKDDPYENGIPGAVELFLCGLRLHRAVRWINPDYKPSLTKEPHCTELKAKRIQQHGLWNKEIAINRMPPWVWWDKIDEWLNVPISEPKKLK